jgi:hypothetical protein
MTFLVLTLQERRSTNEHNISLQSERQSKPSTQHLTLARNEQPHLLLTTQKKTKEKKLKQPLSDLSCNAFVGYTNKHNNENRAGFRKKTALRVPRVLKTIPRRRHETGTNRIQINRRKA